MNFSEVIEFKRFLEEELQPGVKELEKLTDNNRKHIQKLVYTDLVNRFDYMVDTFLLDNCREDQLIEKALSGKNQPVTESDLIDLLMEGDKVQAAIDARLKDGLRMSTLRQRHSRKLHTLLDLFQDIGDFDKRPRVNPATGAILKNIKIQGQNRKQPHSICGYADWLYCRRNAIVHGAGGSRFGEIDKVQVQKLYKVELAKTFKISPSSIRVAAKFYQQLSPALHKFLNF